MIVESYSDFSIHHVSTFKGDQIFDKVFCSLATHKSVYNMRKLYLVLAYVWLIIIAPNHQIWSSVKISSLSSIMRSGIQLDDSCCSRLFNQMISCLDTLILISFNHLC